MTVRRRPRPQSPSISRTRRPFANSRGGRFGLGGVLATVLSGLGGMAFGPSLVRRVTGAPEPPAKDAWRDTERADLLGRSTDSYEQLMQELEQLRRGGLGGLGGGGSTP
jgi:hypothetical protein